MSVSLAFANQATAQSNRIYYPNGRIITSPSTTRIQSTTPSQTRVFGNRVISGPTISTQPATSTGTKSQVLPAPSNPRSAASNRSASQEPISISDQNVSRKPAIDRNIFAMGSEVWQKMLDLERENASLEAELDYERQLAKYREEFENKTSHLAMELREREVAGQEMRERVKQMERETEHHARELTNEVRELTRALEHAEREFQELARRNDELAARLEEAEKRAMEGPRPQRDAGSRPGPPVIMRDRMPGPARRGDGPRIEPPRFETRNHPTVQAKPAKAQEHADHHVEKNVHVSSEKDMPKSKPSSKKPSGKGKSASDKPSDKKNDKRRHQSRKPAMDETVVESEPRPTEPLPRADAIPVGSEKSTNPPIDLPRPNDLPPGIPMPHPQDLPVAK